MPKCYAPSLLCVAITLVSFACTSGSDNVESSGGQGGQIDSSETAEGGMGGVAIVGGNGVAGGSKGDTSNGGSAGMSAAGGSVVLAPVGGSSCAEPATPEFTKPSLVAWDGDTVFDRALKVETVVPGRSCEKVHSGAYSLRLPFAGRGSRLRVWQLPTPVDISNKTTLVAWVMVDAPPLGRPNSFSFDLRSDRSGNEHEHEVGAEIHDSGTESPLYHVVPSFADGQWHEMRLPLSKFCNTTHNEHIENYPCNGFDPRTVMDLRIHDYSAEGIRYTIFLDDIGFD